MAKPVDAIIPKWIFFRGEFVPGDQAKVSVLTHGLNYGTGCFEGIRGYWNPKHEELYLLKAAAHFGRIHQSAKILHMTLGYTVEQLCDITRELLGRNEVREDIYVRPLLYLGEERIGVRLRLRSDFTIFAVPMGEYISAAGIHACVSSWRRIDDNAVPARAKITGAYINSALAKDEALANGFEEAIFLNPDGHVSEGSAANLFMVRGGRLVTPGVNHNILEGVTRAAVMQLGNDELGISTEQRMIDHTELYICDELFLCGTGVQISPVLSVDRRKVGNGEIGPVTKKLQEIYSQIVHGDHPRYRGWITPVYRPPEKV